MYRPVPRMMDRADEETEMHARGFGVSMRGLWSSWGVCPLSRQLSQSPMRSRIPSVAISGAEDISGRLGTETAAKRWIIRAIHPNICTGRHGLTRRILLECGSSCPSRSRCCGCTSKASIEWTAKDPRDRIDSESARCGVSTTAHP